MHDVFAAQSSSLGADRYTEVYFRTESGNIYRLDGRGVLINSNQSRLSGTIAATRLDPRDFQQKRLAVGEKFDYGSGAITTRIVEIVASTSRHYSQTYIYNATNGIGNTVLKEFTHSLPRHK